MARLEFGVPVQLDGQVWFLAFKGLSAQQDVIIRAGSRQVNASRGELKYSGLESVWQLNSDATVFHIDLGKLSGDEALSISVTSREESFLSWIIRNPTGVEYQIDGLGIGRGETLQILELMHKSEGGAHVVAHNQTPGLDQSESVDTRLPLLVREAQSIAKSLSLGQGFDSVVAVVDTTASMREQLLNGNVHRVLEAIRGVSSSVTNAPFSTFFAGIPLPAEVWPSTDIPSLAATYASRFEKSFIQIPPLLELIPDTLARIQGNTIVYVVSDCWFYISQRTLQLLEEKNCQLVIVQLLESSSDFHAISFSHPLVTTRPLLGVKSQTSLARILQALGSDSALV